MAPVYIDDEGQPSPTAHWRVTDSAGGSIVVEIIVEGQVHVYDHHVGVVTNSPHLPWHVTNLDNYVNVRPGTVAQRTVGGITLSSLSATEWTAASDLSNRRFFSTTMHDSAVKLVDLTRLDLSRASETAHALDQGHFTFHDMTPI